MKKKLITLLIGILLVLGAACPAAAASASAGAGTVSYVADFSDGVPADWEKYAACDTANTSAAHGGNTVRLSHSNAGVNASLYHGGVYTVAKDLGSVSDFVLSLKFRFLSYDNDSRWMAVYYHTRVNSNGKLSGYLMNVRVNGNSAQSTVTATPSYTDTPNVDSGADLKDGAYHELTIKLNAGVAEHFLDGTRVLGYETDSKAGVLGGIYADGGFAIGVNRSMIEICGLEITGRQSASSTDGSGALAQTHTATTRLVAAPSVVTRIESADDLQALKGTQPAATAIVGVDGSLNVIDKNGVSLGAFGGICAKYLGKSVIPAVQVTDAASAQAFAGWLKTTGTLDIAVVSADLQLLKSVREAAPWVRGIADYSAESAPDADRIVAEATQALANVVILSEAAACAQTVRYLQARLKTVWTECSATTVFGCAAVVSRGAHGIVTPVPETAYEALKYYTQTNSLARTPYNIAHRGLCISGYENSLESVLAASEKGATHAEIDLKLTADGHIVIMHDDTIDRTTNGTGKVSSLTLKQLKSFKITKNYNGKVMGAGAEIPTLEEFYKAFENVDAVLILELKTSDTQLVSKLKALTDKYGYMYAKIIVIAFDANQLAEMKRVMPQTPTADLNGVSYSAFDSALYKFGYYNTVMDTGYGNVNGYFLGCLRDRGYMGYMWTYGTEREIAEGFVSGVLGMTNNVADALAKIPAKLEAKDKYVTVGRNGGINGGIAATATSYDGSKTEVKATAFMTEERDGALYVILKYRYTAENGTAFTLYSEAYPVAYREVYIPPERLSQRIAALPAEVTLSDKAEVQTLRAAYDMLSAEDKAQVPNASKLAGAEATLQRLEEAANPPGQGDKKPANGGCRCSVEGAVTGAGALGIIAAALAIAAAKRRKTK